MLNGVCAPIRQRVPSPVPRPDSPQRASTPVAATIESAGGRCECDAEWTGPQCGELNLLPTSPSAGFRPPNGSSWGGSIIADSNGGLHMFAALMTEHCGLDTWETNSEVVHAVAASPFAPFVQVAGPPVIPRFAHNPTIHRNAEGRYLLYHIGCGASPSPCPDCVVCQNGTTPPSTAPVSRTLSNARLRAPRNRTPSTTADVDAAGPSLRPDLGNDSRARPRTLLPRAGLSKRGGNTRQREKHQGSKGGDEGDGCNGPHWTGLLSSDSLDGPWVDEGEVVLTTPKSKTWITNPCVVPAGDPASPQGANATTAYLLYRQAGGVWPNQPPNTAERLGWAVATDCPSTINCSYVDKSPTAPILNATLEDQYLWRDHRGFWHALTHKGVEGAVSGHLFSRDGGEWTLSSVAPYNTTIPLTGGGTLECGKRARPMLLVVGGRPRYLTTGASYSPHTDHTFTTLQPINGA